MDARDLRYEDASFDAVFSSSSTEHFETLCDIKQSHREMARVLRPGGVMTLCTEFRLAGERPGWPGTMMFDEEGVRTVIMDPALWEPLFPLNRHLSDATWRSVVEFDRASEEVRRHVGEAWRTDVPQAKMKAVSSYRPEGGRSAVDERAYRPERTIMRRCNPGPHAVDWMKWG